MKKIITLAFAFALTATACGSSESDTSTADPADSSSDAPGLTVDEIGDDSMTVLGSYDINGDELEDGVDGPPSAEATEAFGLYTDLIPAEYREGVVSFVAIDQEASDGTDGALQDVIGTDGEPTGERYLALDITGSSVELERTIVHETGHLIFVTPGSDSNEYADAFNEQFPPGDDFNADDFVTEYAASDPSGGEDIAESWAMFVYGDTDFAGDADDDGELDTVPEGTLAADKVAFFEDYPELVELKADILG